VASGAGELFLAVAIGTPSRRRGAFRSRPRRGRRTVGSPDAPEGGNLLSDNGFETGFAESGLPP
jgi:hypothetical protein